MNYGNFVSIALMILMIVTWGAGIMSFLRRNKMPVRSTSATVCDKYIRKTVSRYPGTGNDETYIVVFDTGKGKLQFAVSEYSYNNYRINEKGTLKYKGSQLIDFK